MRHNYSQPQSPQTFRKIYAGFRGIDLENAPIHVDPTRSPFAQDVLIDDTGVVHKRPPFKRQADYGNDQVHGIFPFVTEEDPVRSPFSPHTIFVHAGEKLFVYVNVADGQLPATTPTPLCTDLNDADSTAFQHGKRLYILDGKVMRVVMEDDATEEYVVKTVQEIATPAETQIDGYYYAETYTDANNEEQTEYTWTFGEKGERNLLTSRRINTFAGDGVHTKFYLDIPNMHVTAVEFYSPTISTAGSGATVTTINAQSNVRNKPSQKNGAIIGKAPANTTYKTYGKQGKWYKIDFPGATEAYIHQDRIATYSPGGASTEVQTNTDEWVDADPTSYTIREATSGDDAANCTVVVFNTAPAAHPRGAGLPNIRVTGAETETATETKKGNGQNNVVFTFPSSSMYIRHGKVTINNGSALTENTDYTVTTNSNGETVITVLGIVGGQQRLHTDDVVAVEYTRESFRDFSVINQCNKYGKFGAYNHDRFWYTGNTDDKNRDWYSEPSDPTLVLENSYTEVGLEGNAIAGYLNLQSDMLIIKYDGETECLYRRTASSDGDITTFPVKSYIGRGAVNAKALVNIKGSCLYMSPEGLMEFASYDLGSKYGTQNRSFLINREIIGDQAVQLGVWRDNVLLATTDGRVFVGNINATTAPSAGGSYGFEWTLWTNFFAEQMCFAFDVLWFARNATTICTVRSFYNVGYYADYPDGSSGEAVPIKAIWATPCDMLDEPARYKYIDRRGAVLNLLPPNPEYSIPQRELKYAVITDSKDVPLNHDAPVDILAASTDYDVLSLTTSLHTPMMLLNARISRFRYIQFVFMHDDPNTDGIEILSLEFQYRFGRYII